MRFTPVSQLLLVAALEMALASIDAAAPPLSPQQADAFLKKLDAIAVPGGKAPASQRTSITEGELNSWFAYRAQPIIPDGLAEPSVSLMGNGKIAGRAIVDLDRVAKKRATGSAFDPWSFVGGRLPVAVTGTLQTKDGVGKFVLESAQVSSVPVPKILLQELLSAYSKTPGHPAGFGLEDPFDLPVNIQRIEVGAGQAVVVQ